MSDDLLRRPAEAASALPAGTRLGEFELLKLLGVGGFGIVYLAFDHALEREVAIKEYMPASMAGRTETMHVSLRSQSDAEVFALGLRSFVNEAKLLARFDHPSLLKVYRFWEANGTAYMAMPVLHGRTLKEIRQGRQSLENPIDERWLRNLLEPLLGALERLHDSGVYHRDIAPDNIQVEPDGRPVLMDFGAARRVISDKTQTLTAILKPAYAPIEQYAEAGSVKQGPWTDLYALGATVHFMLLGRPPEPATARAVNDDQAPLSSQSIEGCGEDFLHVVDWMLAPRPADRPQNVAALREVLTGRVAPPQRRPAHAVSPAQWERTQVVPPPTTRPPPQGVPPVDEDAEATVVVPHSRPPIARTRPDAVMPPAGVAAGGSATAGADAPRGAPPANESTAGAAAAAWARSPSPAAAAPAVPSTPNRLFDNAAGASGSHAASGPAASPSTPAAPPDTPAGRSKLVPVAALGVAVVAAIAAAIGLWPRGDEVAAVAPAASAAPILAGPAASASGTAAVPAPGTAPTATIAAPAGVGAGPTPAGDGANAGTASPAATPSTPVATATAPGGDAKGAPADAAPTRPATPTPQVAAGADKAGTGSSVASPAPPVASTRPPTAPAPTTAAATPPRPSPQRPGPGPSTDAGSYPGTTARVEPPAATPPPPPVTTPPRATAAAPAAPAAVTTPAPAMPVDAAPPDSPELRCAVKNPFAHFVCMEKECYRSEFMKHPDCLKWRRNARPPGSPAN